MANIPANFLSTGIARVMTNQSITSLGQGLPTNSSSLLPSDEGLSPALEYAKTAPTVQNRALKVLQPDLGPHQDILLRGEYNSVGQSVNALFKNPPPDLVEQLKDTDGSDWLVQALQSILPDNEANFAILDAGANALRPA